MDEKFKILLGSAKNVNSVNVDTYARIELNNKIDEITEYNINNTISASDIFNAEREASEIYRIYGRIEYMSLLNNLKNINANPSINDFFIPYFPTEATLSNTSRTILNSFNFYLLRPSTTGYTNITISGDSTYYIRDFKVIATPDQFDIYPAGYSNNVFNEQTYSFNFNVDINIENWFANITIDNYLENIGIPITELYLFAEYIPTTSMSKKYTIWNSGGTGTTINYDATTNVYRDVIQYTKEEYLIQNYINQTHYISILTDNGTSVAWKYNPLTPLILRYLSDDVSTANINDISYEVTSTIPYYAVKENDPPLIDNGTRIWREILPQGYIDPISGLGVNYPFINNKRYLFSNIILDIIPDLDDQTTKNIFQNLNFYDPILLNTQPSTNINNIGNSC